MAETLKRTVSPCIDVTHTADDTGLDIRSVKNESRQSRPRKNNH